MRTILLLALSVSAFAGQGLPRTSAETASNSSVAAQPVNGPCRLEVAMYAVDSAPEGNFHSIQSGNACGINWQWIPVGPGDLRIQLYGDNTTGGGVCQILGVASRLDLFYIRFQLIPDGAGGVQLCQAWDADGVRFHSETQPYTGTTGSHSNGLTIASAGTSSKSLSWGFVKLYTTTVSETARMPVNGENGDLLSWLFNGNGDDTSGNHYDASFSGAASYTTQPGQDLIKAVVKTTPAPTWTDRRTLRVGVSNALDASNSFSQADGSPTVTCDWALDSSQPMGLTLPFSDATNNCSPGATPSDFGDYLVGISLTNIDMVTETPQIHIGAAKMTAEGVITPDDPNITKIFGPMIALGWTPWAWMDERWSFAQTARRAVYQTPPAYLPSYTQVSNPVWANFQTGTVDWTWNGTGFGGGGVGTTLATGISPTDGTIVLTSTTGLDLSILPTKISIIGSGTSEEIDICNAVVLTLTVCYDGRGKVGPFGRQTVVLGPTSWSMGATVGQGLLKGTGTNFIKSEGLAESGPGPIGPVTYDVNTVSVTAGSAAVSGDMTDWLTNASSLATGSAAGIYSSTVIGGSWATGTATIIVNTNIWSVGGKISVQGVGPSGFNVIDATVTASSDNIVSYAVASDPGMFSSNGTAYLSNGYAIRIEGTHGVAHDPFDFYAYISSASSNTAMVMNRVFPADADSGSGLTYQIIRPFFRYPVMQFTAEEGVEDNDEATAGWAGTSCISDTQCFFNPQIGGADVVGYSGTPQSGAYTFYDVDGSVINQGGSIDFYGEELAWYAGHFRSGLYEPLDTARMMANTFIKYPSLRGGLGGINPSSPLLVGGGINGAFACLTVDSGCGLEWKNARGFVYQGNFWATDAGSQPRTCNSQDSRDGGYLGSWLAMGANFDPLEASYNWADSFPTWYAFEDSCKGSDNSWANNFLTNRTQFPAATLTMGDDAGTGTGFTAGMCFGRAQGNFSINAATGVVTATSSAFNAATDQRTLVLNVSGHRLFVQVDYTDSTHMTIRAEWPAGWATTGTWMQTTGETSDLIGMTSWGQDENSISYQSNYECIYNSPTSITLERDWEYATGAYIPTVSTRLGIAIAGFGTQPYMTAFRAFAFQLAANKDADQGTSFGTLKEQISTWASNTGYDPVVRGLLSGAIFQSCTPAVVPTGSGGTSFTQPGCSYSLIPAAQIAGRELNAEGGRAFLYNTTNNLTRGDDQYEALWCSTQYNDPTYYASIPACDAVSPGDNIGLSVMSDANFTGNKWSGFFFGMGMAHQWPAFRQEEPASTSGVSISGAVKFSGAVTIH